MAGDDAIEILIKDTLGPYVQQFNRPHLNVNQFDHEIDDQSEMQVDNIGLFLDDGSDQELEDVVKDLLTEINPEDVEMADEASQIVSTLAVKDLNDIDQITRETFKTIEVCSSNTRANQNA